jgi:hypothetical protein
MLKNIQPYTVCLIIIALLLCIPFFYCMFSLFPLADDFGRARTARYLFDFYEAQREIISAWKSWSGRFTHNFVAVFWGDAAMQRFSHGLLCSAIMVFSGVSVFGILNRVCGGACKTRCLFLAVSSVLLIFCAYQTLDIVYYMQASILGLGLGSVLLLAYIWSLCSLWYKERLKIKDRWLAYIAGGAAAGCYEHAAVAVLIASAFALLLSRIYSHRHSKIFQRVAVVVGITVLIAFLAPGNFNRAVERNVGFAQIISQLIDVIPLWFSSAPEIFVSPFIPGVLAVFLLLPPGSGTPVWHRISGFKVFLALAAGFLALTFGIITLHAFSDTPFDSTPKLKANMLLLEAFYLAFAALLCRPAWLKRVAPLWGKLAGTAMLIICFFTANLQNTLANINNGSIASYVCAMEERMLILEQGAGRDIRLAPMLVTPFPVGRWSNVPSRPEEWEADSIVELYALNSVSLQEPALTVVAKRLAEAAPWKPLSASGRQYAVLKNTSAGPNSSYNYTWLLINSMAAEKQLAILLVPEAGFPLALQKPLQEKMFAGEEITLPPYYQYFACLRYANPVNCQLELQPPQAAETTYAIPLYYYQDSPPRALYVSFDHKRFYRLEL